MIGLLRKSLALLILLGATHNSSAQEWTRFRGPNGTGISQAKTIPTTWSEKDINWKVGLPGAGHSSPVLWGEKVFLASADDQTGEVFVLCVNAANGAVLWQKNFPFSKYRKHDYNSFASGSPAVDEHRVYACWSSPSRLALVALDHKGDRVWEKNLGAFASQHGSGTSPIVYQDKVVLADEQDGESFLIAVDARTGETRWKTPRKTTQTAYGTSVHLSVEGW